MLETENEIRTYILSKLKQIQTCRISAINSNCKDESMCLKVISDLVNEGIIEKDDNFIWLKE